MKQTKKTMIMLSQWALEEPSIWGATELTMPRQVTALPHSSRTLADSGKIIRRCMSMKSLNPVQLRGSNT